MTTVFLAILFVLFAITEWKLAEIRMNQKLKSNRTNQPTERTAMLHIGKSDLLPELLQVREYQIDDGRTVLARDAKAAAESSGNLYRVKIYCIGSKETFLFERQDYFESKTTTERSKWKCTQIE